VTTILASGHLYRDGDLTGLDMFYDLFQPLARLGRYRGQLPWSEAQHAILRCRTAHKMRATRYQVGAALVGTFHRPFTDDDTAFCLLALSERLRWHPAVMEELTGGFVARVVDAADVIVRKRLGRITVERLDEPLVPRSDLMACEDAFIDLERTGVVGSGVDVVAAHLKDIYLREVPIDQS